MDVVLALTRLEIFLLYEKAIEWFLASDFSDISSFCIGLCGFGMVNKVKNVSISV